MNLKQKLLLGFAVTSLLVGAVGALGLYANAQIVREYESGEAHFGIIVDASNEVSSYAKRAEGHAMLYLSLHNESDRKKFSDRIASLREQITIILRNADHPEAKAILVNITSKTDELQSVGEQLFIDFDSEMAATGTFDFVRHEKEVRALDRIAAGIRSDGLALSKLEVSLQEKDHLAAKASSASLYRTGSLIVIIVFFSALFFGYRFSARIVEPVAKLKRATENIEKGDYSVRVKYESDDEFGGLAQAFNKMAQNLQVSGIEISKRESALKSSKKALEEKVSELEKFTKLTVDRELKMAEIKAKLKEIERSKKSKGA